MDQEIAAVKSALNRFAAHFQAEEQLRWGLVVGPKKTPLDLAEHLYLISDVSPFADFLSDFAALGNHGMNTSQEMLRDALYFSLRNISANVGYDPAQARWRERSETGSTPVKERFLISWRPEVDKIIIVFSDEEDQSHLDPELMPEDVAAALAGTPRLKLYTFTTMFNGGNWEAWANQTGGINFELTWNQNQMYESLMSIIDEACLPPDNARPAEEQEEQANNSNNNGVRQASLFTNNYHYDHINMVCL